MKLYHGSDQIVRNPQYGTGKEDNDYGSGFYTTEDIEKANAWAVVNGGENAYCNAYNIDLTGLKVLRLDEFGILAWIAEVIAHRGVNDEEVEYVGQALVEKYKIDTNEYDVIIGYRADDSYTQVIESFLKNQLNIDEVERFFYKGNLGKQFFIKSRAAFGKLQFVGAKQVLGQERYYHFDLEARREVSQFLNNRRRMIQIEGFVPRGLTVQEVLSRTYVYNTESMYYEIAHEEGERQNVGL